MATVELMTQRDLVAEWESIIATLREAVKRDPKRKLIDLMGLGFRGEMAFWRVQGEAAGYIVTQMTRRPKSFKRTFWIIYAGGVSGGFQMARNLMAGFEKIATENECDEVRFEGRDWRKVLRDYNGYKGPDGRWNFRKELVA